MIARLFLVGSPVLGLKRKPKGEHRVWGGCSILRRGTGVSQRNRSPAGFIPFGSLPKGCGLAHLENSQDIARGARRTRTPPKSSVAY